MHCFSLHRVKVNSKVCPIPNLVATIAVIIGTNRADQVHIVRVFVDGNSADIDQTSWLNHTGFN